MGTHPIFESDFDCLTAMDNLIREFEIFDCSNENRQEKMKRRYDSMLSTIKHGLKCNKSNYPEPHCESMKNLQRNKKPELQLLQSYYAFTMEKPAVKKGVNFRTARKSRK